MKSSFFSWLRARSFRGALVLVIVLTVIVTVRVMRSRPTELQWVTVERAQLETRDGVFFLRETSVPFTGLITDRDPNGAVRVQSAVVAGLLHGVSRGWFTNGVPEVQEEFQRGLAHGQRTTWYPHGQMRSQGRLEAGKQEGSYRQWNEQGVLMAEATFEAGQPHGLSRAWHADGSLKAEVRMNHGQVQERHVYPPGTRWETPLGVGNEITLTATPNQ